MMENIGFTSALLLAFCSLPMLFKTIKDKHCDGISGWFIFLWFLGEVTGLIYVIPMRDIPLILNYSLNTIITFIVFMYKVRRK